MVRPHRVHYALTAGRTVLLDACSSLSTGVFDAPPCLVAWRPKNDHSLRIFRNTRNMASAV